MSFLSVVARMFRHAALGTVLFILLTLASLMLAALPFFELVDRDYFGVGLIFAFVFTCVLVTLYGYHKNELGKDLQKESDS